MLNLLTGDYSYSLNDLVQVRVKAHNSQGDGLDSAALSSGATVRTKPAKMTSPYKASNTSTSQLQVQWDALTGTANTGGSTILAYNVYWDNGST